MISIHTSSKVNTPNTPNTPDEPDYVGYLAKMGIIKPYIPKSAPPNTSACVDLRNSLINNTPPIQKDADGLKGLRTLVSRLAPKSKAVILPMVPVADGKWFKLPWLVLDFETRFAKDYSLSKMECMYYIHDPRFKIHGLAIRHPDGRTEFRTDIEQAVEELKSMYGANLEKVCSVAHNATFDFYILKVKFGIVPANMVDTMLCARLVHNRRSMPKLKKPNSLAALAEFYGLPRKGNLDFMSGVTDPTPEQIDELRAYAINDVGITARLAEIMIPKVEPDIEFWAMEHTIRMFLQRPFLVDPLIAEDTLKEVDTQAETELSDAGYTLEQISEDKIFYELFSKALSKTGRAVPMKQGKKKMIPAIAGGDEAMQSLLEDFDPDVKKLAELRLLVGSLPNIRSRLRYLVDSAGFTGGYYHASLEYSKAVTGRFTGAGGFSAQNITVPEETEASKD